MHEPIPVPSRKYVLQDPHRKVAKVVTLPQLVLVYDDEQGWGVFAAEDIASKTIITGYGGTFVTDDQIAVLKAKSEDTHLQHVRDTPLIIDGKGNVKLFARQHLVGSLLNARAEKMTNCKVIVSNYWVEETEAGLRVMEESDQTKPHQLLPMVWTIATKPIAKGTELVRLYGGERIRQMNESGIDTNLPPRHLDDIGVPGEATDQVIVNVGLIPNEKRERKPVHRLHEDSRVKRPKIEDSSDDSSADSEVLNRSIFDKIPSESNFAHLFSR